jgi:phosphoribosylaminoimidazole-succinocarboxamide synthase
MVKIYTGKTKDVYKLEDGNYLLKFKDDVTVDEKGNFDPGANVVGLTIEGAGQAELRLTKFFFEKLREKGIETHYIDADLEDTSMTVKPAETFGKGLEVILRYKAVGSFIRRYGDYIAEGTDLDSFVEISLKDDKRGDPFINKEALDILNLLTPDEYDLLVSDTKKIALVIKEELAKKGLELYDIKFEFGRSNGKIILIDEISAGNMRAYKDGKHVGPLDIEKLMLD